MNESNVEKLEKVQGKLFACRSLSSLASGSKSSSNSELRGVALEVFASGDENRSILDASEDDLKAVVLDLCRDCIRESSISLKQLHEAVKQDRIDLAERQEYSNVSSVLMSAVNSWINDNPDSLSEMELDCLYYQIESGKIKSLEEVQQLYIQDILGQSEVY